MLSIIPTRKQNDYDVVNIFDRGLPIQDRLYLPTKIICKKLFCQIKMFVFNNNYICRYNAIYYL
jgi:hypothetical protein